MTGHSELIFLIEKMGQRADELIQAYSRWVEIKDELFEEALVVDPTGNDREMLVDILAYFHRQMDAIGELDSATSAKAAILVMQTSEAAQ